MPTTIETAWASELKGQIVQLRCLIGPVCTVADRAALQQRVECGEGDMFESPVGEALVVASGQVGNTRWTVLLAEVVGSGANAYVPLLRVGQARRVRVIDGRASPERVAALAHAHELAAEIRAGTVPLRLRKRRASSGRALSDLVDAAFRAARDAESQDPAHELRLGLVDAHETDIELVEIIARRVREILDEVHRVPESERP